MCAWIDSVPKFLDLDMEYNPLTLSINLLINNIEYWFRMIQLPLKKE